MKRLISLLAALLLCSPSVSAFAQDSTVDYQSDAKSLVDSADLLTDREEEVLLVKVKALIEEHGVDIALMTVKDCGETDVVDFADGYYDANGYGMGESRDGLLFVLDIGDRSFFTSTNGFCETALTAYAISSSEGYINAQAMHDLSQGNYYRGMDIYLELVDVFLEQAKTGEPFDESNPCDYQVSTTRYDENYDYSSIDSGGKYVLDNADLFTDGEEAELLARVDALREKYQFDVVLLTVDDIGEKSVADFADDYYDYNGFGAGENRDGLLFMINMGERDYYTSTCGFGITAFTDYAIGSGEGCINDAIVGDLSAGDYFGAFSTYLDYVDIFLEQAKTGKPFDYSNPYKTVYDYVASEIMVIGVAMLIGFLVANSMKKKMNTAVSRHEASDYIVPGSLNLTHSNEIFKGSTVSKKLKAPPPSSSSGSSGGSSSHRSSSGSSHGGGGGKF